MDANDELMNKKQRRGWACGCNVGGEFSGLGSSKVSGQCSVDIGVKQSYLGELLIRREPVNNHHVT